MLTDDAIEDLKALEELAEHDEQLRMVVEEICEEISAVLASKRRELDTVTG